MFRAALLRNVATSAVRTAMRPATTAAPVAARLVARRTVAAPSWVAPKTAAWTSVRCYSAGGALTKEDVEARIIGVLMSFDKVNVEEPNQLTSETHFANDLGLDSLDTVEVVMAIEEEFSIEIPDKDADTILSIGKAVQYILSQPDAN